MTEKFYTGEETISYILMDLPESYEVFASYGLTCAGCPVAPMEGLREGAAAHGLVGATFEQLLEDLNEMKAEKLANY
jgi:hybrid cluster-associated redox disulfide protein